MKMERETRRSIPPGISSKSEATDLLVGHRDPYRRRTGETGQSSSHLKASPRYSVALATVSTCTTTWPCGHQKLYGVTSPEVRGLPSMITAITPTESVPCSKTATGKVPLASVICTYSKAP